MIKFFTLTFWFNLRPGHLTSTYQSILMVLLILLFVLSIISTYLKRDRKSVYYTFWKKVFVFSATNLSFGLVLWFMNYELIPFFSSRFWYLIWILGMAVWIFFIIKNLRSIPERKQEMIEKQKYNKYIP